MALNTWPVVLGPVTDGALVTFDGTIGNKLQDGGVFFEPWARLATVDGAVGDVTSVSDAAITATDNTLTSASNPWTSADVGKRIAVPGAGAAGVSLFTTIASFTSAGEVELTAAASTTVTGKTAQWGTDNSAAIQATIDAMDAAGGGLVVIPQGKYALSAELDLPNFVILMGVGDASILSAFGNFYCVGFNPGNRAGIRDLSFEAAAPQASGGGIDYTDAGSNTTVQDVYLSNNLATGINCAPTTAGTINHRFFRLRWNGVQNSSLGINVGDGTNSVQDIYFDTVSGSASSSSHMVNWVFVNVGTQNVFFTNCTFLNASGRGMVLGLGSSGAAIDVRLTNVNVAQMTSDGISIRRTQDCILSHCRVNNGSGVGIVVGVGVTLGTVIHATTVYQNASHGIQVASVATLTKISCCTISDNNTANSASTDGILINANTTDFYITDVLSGNNLLGSTGHQKYGIRVATGTSDRYIIQSNHNKGNDTGTISDGGSGGTKVVADNI